MNGPFVNAGSLSQLWAARYVGIPFSDDGLDFTACSCWGLVRLVLLRECAIEVPTYGELSAKQLRAAAELIGLQSLVPPWIEVEGEWRAFDVVLMHARRGESGRIPGHVGIVSEPKHILHVERATSAVNVPLNHVSVRHRIIKAFRHEALA